MDGVHGLRFMRHERFYLCILEVYMVSRSGSILDVPMSPLSVVQVRTCQIDGIIV
jgi:hypothetical protein